MSGTVSPNTRVWSRLMDVMAQTSGATTFVASRRPPRPTSTTWNAAPMFLKCRKAIVVSNSK